MNKLKIAAAVAFALSASVVNASTIVLSGGGSKLVASTSAAANLKALASTANEIATMTGVTAELNADGELFQVGDVITITVAGATFDRAALTATPVAWTGTGATKPAATWVLDATNKILTGTVTTASVTANAATIIATLTGKFDLTGVASGTTPGIDMVVSRSVLGQTTQIHSKATGATALQVFEVVPAIQNIAVTAVDGTVKVADAFLKIGGALTHTIANGSVATGTKLDSNAAAATGTIKVTLTGVPIAATKITWGTTTGAISQTLADGVTAPTTATVGSQFYLDGTGNAYAVLNNAAAQAVFNDSANMVLTVDGTTAILSTDMKISFDYLAGTSDKFTSHSILAPTSVASLQRDGSSFTVNSAGSLNTIKITDVSGGLTAASGTISVVGYNADGTVSAGTAPTFSALASNGTTVISMSTLTTAFPTAVRFDFTVESTEIVASNVKKSSTGTTVTTYRNNVQTATKVGNGAL